MTQPDAGATQQVVLAHPMEINGKQYQADDVVEVPATQGNGRYGTPNAAQLIRDGHARPHDQATRAKSRSSGTKEG